MADDNKEILVAANHCGRHRAHKHSYTFHVSGIGGRVARLGYVNGGAGLPHSNCNADAAEVRQVGRAGGL